MEIFKELDESEFLPFVFDRFCPECGEPVVQPSRGRKKFFCSDACRFAWKRKHERPEKWKNSRQAFCPMCGREFTASREYGRKRKYCSHACANRGRALEKRGRMLPMAEKSCGTDGTSQEAGAEVNSSEDERRSDDGGESTPL